MTMAPPQRILYIEDEPDIQAVATLALEHIGRFTVQACSSGEEAVVQAAGFLPDIILLDIMMPGMDGPATLQALRKHPHLQGVPAIFMTAKVGAGDCRGPDVLAVIPKPFDPMTLAQQIHDIWNAHHD